MLGVIVVDAATGTTTIDVVVATALTVRVTVGVGTERHEQAEERSEFAKPLKQEGMASALFSLLAAFVQE